MARLWVKLISDNRISRQFTEECQWNNTLNALNSVCHKLDLECPILLDKHRREFDLFRRTSFLPEHFIDSVDFDRMEVEFIEDSRSRSSHDPRNAF